MDSADASTIRKPFIEHVQEFRRRLIWSCLALLTGGVVGYSLYGWLLDLVQRPLGQTLYYTSPTGGFNFAFKICVVFGLVFALPVICYHLYKFFEPVSNVGSRLSMIAYVLWSVDLAYAGIIFGYFVSLPAALHFLIKFGGQNIQSLITADEYFSFALAYIAGFALLFQLPLIIIFLNRITPLKPSQMMKAQRYVILVSFIVAAILTPTPDPVNQFIMAFPIVLLYQVSILIVWSMNRKSYNNKSSVTEKKPLKKATNIYSHTAKQNNHKKQICPPQTSNPTKIFDIVPPQVAEANNKVANKISTERKFIETREEKFERVLSQNRRSKLIDITV